ncbi:MAG: hypothetical protein JO157_18280 [Acetobacteraceae bacterium]|nr:hypothetical protein [Acetobacteraceae bacterium]
MIRPFTFVALLLAGTSGLYLYQAKHRAEVLDQQITHTLRQAAATRERIGLLRAEWALLNEPDRLNQLAGQHLGLEPLQPSRFVAAADLASHIPIPPPPEAPAETPVAAEAPAPLPGDVVRVTDTTPTPAAAPALSPIVAPPRPTLVTATTRVPPPQPRPAPSRAAARPHPAYKLASSAAPEPATTAPARQPVYASVLRTAAPPIAAPSFGATQVGLFAARAPTPVVTSALGGYGRSSLAPPIPVGSR